MADPWADFRETAAPAAGTDLWVDFRERPSSALEAVGRGAEQAGTFGFSDELKGLAAAGGAPPGEDVPLRWLGYVARGGYRKYAGDAEAQARYEREVAQQRAETRQLAQQHPGAFTAGQVATAVAMPLPVTLRGATWGGRALQGAGLGAATGGLTGLGEAEGTLAERLPQAAVPTAIGAATGGLGGAIFGRAERAAERAAVPPSDVLHGRADVLYDQFRKLGFEIRPAAAENFATSVRSELTQAGLDKHIAPKTWGILADLDSERVLTDAQSFQSLRKTLGRAAGSADPQERLAASTAKNRLDDMLADPAAIARGDAVQASNMLREANANYAAAERAAALDKRLTAAELRAASSYSGLNLENQIRQRMAQVLSNPSLQRGYTPAELAEMAAITRGSNIGNIGRWARNLLGGGGGLGALATGGAGAGVGSYLGLDPATSAIAAPAGGLALAALGNRATMARARALESAIRARSPLAQQMTGSAPLAAAAARAVAPVALLPPALARSDALTALTDLGQ
jgi:hypothetical protein